MGVKKVANLGKRNYCEKNAPFFSLCFYDALKWIFVVL